MSLTTPNTLKIATTLGTIIRVLVELRSPYITPTRTSVLRRVAIQEIRTLWSLTAGCDPTEDHLMIVTGLEFSEEELL